ncbi:MAG: zinc ribbon domain-containing protein [Ruminococcus sp.]|nr:zinc ribbon domain-containing protein [Ruminococcus sp.]
MICKKCGKTISDNAKFCSQCGEKIEADNISEDISEEKLNEISNTETVQNDEQDTKIENCEINSVQNKKKKLFPFIIGGSAIILACAVFVVLFVTHVICFHDWVDANCIAPKTCSICGKTEGLPLGHDFSEATCTKDSVCSLCGEIGAKALGHDWSEATCTEDAICKTCGEHGDKAIGHSWKNATCLEPKTCTNCGKTEGKANGHKWQEATCDKPKTCSVCKETDGKELGHDWAAATVSAPKTCRRCGETTGEKLKTYDVYFSASEIIAASGVMRSEFDVYEVSGISCSNGSAYASTESVGRTFHCDNLIGINVSQATAGQVTISGTISSMHLVIREAGQSNAWVQDSRYFEITKTVG